MSYHPLLFVSLGVVHQATLVFWFLSLSLVNYGKCMHSFLLNFVFQYFPWSIAGPLPSKRLAVVTAVVWGVTKHVSAQSGVRASGGCKKVKDH